MGDDAGAQQRALTRSTGEIQEEIQTTVYSKYQVCGWWWWVVHCGRVCCRACAVCVACVACVACVSCEVVCVG